VPVIIAVDAVAIITHPHVGIDSLSMTQLGKLFSGEIKNWKEIGGADLPVVVIGRNENSGTYHYLLDHLRINGFAPGATIKPGNAEILDAVSTREGALGYVNLGSIYDDEGKPRKNIWVAGLYVEGSIAYSPYRTEYVLNGEYPLTRPLYQYVDRNSSETVRDFIRLELSKEVQTGLQARGYFPIAAIHAEMNRKNGF
jgi:phosphate transport system substrate-binding protein